MDYDIYIDESVDPDLDWACRMTLLEMNNDPALVNDICHTLSYERVVSLCLNDGMPLTEGIISKTKKLLTVAAVITLAHLVYKRWKHIDKSSAAKKAAKKAKELAGAARQQGRKKAAVKARQLAKHWEARAKKYDREERAKQRKTKRKRK
jgi:hypothetical protein